MSISPLITFKAGRCELDTSSRPYKVTCDPTPGYIFLYSEDELIHFCWCERTKALNDEDNLDLVMFPTDGHFEPYEYKTREEATSKTNGRIYVLKFSSSSQRHLFWLQSKPQAENGDPSWFSPRDRKLGVIVDDLLQGEEIDVSQAIANLNSDHVEEPEDDDPMEDVEEDHGDDSQPGSGGAGADATGGDIREDGAGAREGGADGGRAAGSGPRDAATVVQNFLNSLKGGPGMQHQQAQGKTYTTLPDLLPTSTTKPVIETATSAQLDDLLSYVPPSIFRLAIDPYSDADAPDAKIEDLTLNQKKIIVNWVLKSPQFHQGLGSLTMAIRDGGLPSIGDALGIKLQHGGLVRGGSVPLGGGEAVEAFVEGIRKTVEEKK